MMLQTEIDVWDYKENAINKFYTNDDKPCVLK
jgi:hypothetical protein